MKKCLFISSFVLIFILVIGAASAADNITDDSLMSVPTADADGLEMEPADADNYNSMNDLNNQEDIISADGKDTPVVDVDDVSVIEGENTDVQFNVTDSNGSLICGDVNVTISGENSKVSKIIKVNNGSAQFTMADLIEIVKANNQLDIVNFYNIISSSINSTNSNFSEVISGLGEVYAGLNLNTSVFISGILDLINSSDVDVERFMDGLDKIEKGINVSMLTDGLSDLMDATHIDAPTLLKVFGAVIGGFDLNPLDIIKQLQKGVSVNLPVMIVGIAALNNELGLFKVNSILDIFNGFGLSYSLGNVIKAGVILSKGTVTLSDLAGLFNDILKYNSLTPAQYIKKMFSTDKIIDIVNKLASPDVNKKNIGNALTTILMSVKMDSKVLDSVLRNIEKSAYNTSKVIKELSAISTINNSSDFNSSKIIDGLYKVAVASTLNVSSIMEGLNEVLTSIKFYVPESVYALNKIMSSFDCDSAMIVSGMDRIAGGLGLDVSSAAGKIIAEYGYFATFSGPFAPGVYNISVEYLANDRYDAAKNDASKLTVIGKKDTPIAVAAVVNASKVTIKGSIDSNAGGAILLLISDYAVFAAPVNGSFEYDASFNPGVYDVKVLYSGNEQFRKNSTSTSFIIKAPTNVAAGDVKTTYGTSKNIVITLSDAAGNPLEGKDIAVKVNGQSYNRVTNSKGQVSIAVPKNLAPKTYTASISFAGDDKCIKSSGTAKVTVSKAKAKITAKAKTFKAKTKTKSYTIVLKNDKGKVIKNAKVTIKVNGKTYKATTNSKGKATFKITKLTKKATFTAAVKYDGNKYYNKVTKNVKITVK